MRDGRFARRAAVPTDLYWLPAMAALNCWYGGFCHPVN